MLHLLLEILIIHLEHVGSLVAPLAPQSYSRPFRNEQSSSPQPPTWPACLNYPLSPPRFQPHHTRPPLPHCHTSFLKIPLRSHCYQTFNRSPLSAAAIQTTRRASQLSYRQPTTLQSPLNTISPSPAAMLCPQVCSSAQVFSYWEGTNDVNNSPCDKLLLWSLLGLAQKTRNHSTGGSKTWRENPTWRMT